MDFGNVIKSVDDLFNDILNIKEKPSTKKQPDKANSQLSNYQEKYLEDNFDGKWQNPIRGTYYNSGAYQQPDEKHAGVHNGVDLRAAGGTDIYPIAPGFVENVAAWDKGGNIVTILHPYGVRVYMAHLGTINVKSGDFVSKDTIIGTIGDSGNAGKYGTYPHIHLEIKVNGSLVDPGKFVYVPPYTNFDKNKEKAWLSEDHKQQARSFKLV